MEISKNYLTIKQRLRLALPPQLAGETLTVALSGGVDSVVLLRLLRGLVGEIGFELCALHVNHHLHSDSNRWAQFCQTLCASLQIPFQMVSAPVPLSHSLEDAARKERYRVFRSHGSQWVALAHHANDQAETMLLQLLRGAGIKGASAMWPMRHEENVSILRPLLAVRHDELIRLARDKGWAWAEDPDNTSPLQRRNRLRHDILPKLEEIFPGAVTTLGRSAKHFQEASLLLSEVAREDLQFCIDQDAIKVEKFKQLTAKRQRNLLRHVWLWRDLPPPNQACLSEGLRQLLCSISGRLISKPLCLHRYRSGIYLFATESHPSEPKIWQGDSQLPWAGGLLSFSQSESLFAMKGKIIIQCRQGGEKLATHVGGPHHSLKNLFQAKGIPPWLRAYWPLLYAHNRLIAVPNIACEPMIESGTQDWQVRWQPPALSFEG